MHFIGIFTDNKNFELIKGKLLKNLNSEKFNIININKKNIENFKHKMCIRDRLCTTEQGNRLCKTTRLRCGI